MAIRAIATDSQDFNNPSTTGKPGRDERLDFKNEAGDTVFSIVSDADGTASIQGDAVPKVYRALLTQSGTDAPTATVLENTLGGTVVWARSSMGAYTGTLTGAFPLDKTLVTSSVQDGDGQIITCLRLDADAITVQALADELLDGRFGVLVFVYP